MLEKPLRAIGSGAAGKLPNSLCPMSWPLQFLNVRTMRNGKKINLSGSIDHERTEKGKRALAANRKCFTAILVITRHVGSIDRCGAYITGGTSSGMNFRVGDLAVNESQAATMSTNLQFLLDEVKRFIEKLNPGGFRVVTA